jgi:hypothetical protein
MRPRDAAALLAKAKAMGATRATIRMSADGTFEIDAQFSEPAGFDSAPEADLALARWTNATTPTTRRARRKETTA